MRRRERQSKRATLIPIVLVSVVALAALVWAAGWFSPQGHLDTCARQPTSAGRLGAKPSARWWEPSTVGF
jgi:hypothetical protein